MRQVSKEERINIEGEILLRRQAEEERRRWGADSCTGTLEGWLCTLNRSSLRKRKPNESRAEHKWAHSIAYSKMQRLHKDSFIKRNIKQILNILTKNRNFILTASQKHLPIPLKSREKNLSPWSILYCLYKT